MNDYFVKSENKMDFVARLSKFGIFDLDES